MNEPQWKILNDEKSKAETEQLLDQAVPLQKRRKWPWSRMEVKAAVDFNANEFDLNVVLKAAKDYGYAQNKRFGVIQLSDTLIRIVRIS